MKVRNSAMDPRQGRVGRGPSTAPALLVGWGSVFAAVVVPVSVSVSLLVPGAALAADAPSSADQALATTLFREGRRLMDAGQIDAACDKLAESQRLEPGGGTLLNLAACHEKQGKTASAWTEFNAALAQARRDAREDRAKVASERIASLEARLSTLTIHVQAPAADVTVTLDRTAVRAPAWGVAVPVDPGEHVIEATAPHKKSFRVTVTIGTEHDAQVAQVPALAALDEGVPIAPAAAASTSPPGSAATKTAATPIAPASSNADADAPRASHAGRDGFMVGAAVLGVAGVAVGTIFGLRALSKHSESNDQCPGEICTRDGAALNDSARSAGNVSTGAFAIGAAGLGTAAILFFTRPSSKPGASSSAPTSAPIAGGGPSGAFVGWRATF